MTHPALKRAAARLALGLHSAVPLIDAANAARNDGVRSHLLRDLAKLLISDTEGSSAARLCRLALADLGVPIPPPDDATITLLVPKLGPLIEGMVSPGDALWTLERELTRFLGPPRFAAPIDSPTDILHSFNGYGYIYDDAVWPNEPEAQEARRAQLANADGAVIALAEKWFRDHGRRAIAPEWRTQTVLALAESIRAAGAFDRLPVLADALEEAGCDDVDILRHCRGDPFHVRGCWVVECLLAGPS